MPKKYQKSSTVAFKYENVGEVPSSMNWRTKGAVMPVKNQRGCGSCWAFATVAAMEGIVQIKTGKAFSLSEQEVIDCNGAPNGCRAGSLQQASDIVIRNHSLTTDTSYPYAANDKGACSSNKTPPAATINGYQSVPQGDEGALLKAIANQPVAVVLDPSLLQFYKSGIISGECGLTLHHAITAVGYGTSENGTKYWMFKNSGGPNWGENGYVRMQRDIGATEGICGIAMGPLYPTA